MNGLKEDLENIDLLAKVVVVRKVISLSTSHEDKEALLFKLHHLKYRLV